MKPILILVCLSLALIGGCKLSSSSEGPVGDNALRLSWTQPEYFEDETKLDANDISNYYVYWGENESDLTNIEEVPSDVTEINLEDIPEGTFYFAVAVETKSGNRSLLSNIESKTFN